MKSKIPSVTFFDYEEASSLKFVQLYIRKNELMLPYMRFENADDNFHGKILEKMLLMYRINDFDTKIGLNNSQIPEIGGSETNYHACGMGYAIKDEGELFINDMQSGDYGIGLNKEHFDLIAPDSKIKLVSFD